MAKGYTFGKMGGSTKGVTSMTRNMEGACIHGQMEEVLRENGCRGSGRARAGWLVQRGKVRKGCGRMIEDSTGLDRSPSPNRSRLTSRYRLIMSLFSPERRNSAERSSISDVLYSLLTPSCRAVEESIT